MRRHKEPTPNPQPPTQPITSGPTPQELQAQINKAVQQHMHPTIEPHICLACGYVTDNVLSICRRCNDAQRMPNDELMTASLMGWPHNTHPADLLDILGLTLQEVLNEANKILSGEKTRDDIAEWLCLTFDRATLEPINPLTIDYPMIPQGDWKDAPLVRSTSARIDPTPADKIQWTSAPRPPSPSERAAQLAANERALADRRRLVQEQHLAQAEERALQAQRDIEAAQSALTTTN